MTATNHVQIIMAAHDRVAKLDVTDDGLVKVPGVERAVPRQVAVSKAIRELVAELSEGSTSWKLIDRLTGNADGLEVKRFVGTLVKVTREKTSTRGKLLLHTGTTREYKGIEPGYEVVRTERTDSPEGLMLASEAKALVGHRVLVWMVIEPWVNDSEKTTRVLVHLMDLGVDSHFDQATQTIAA